MEERDDIEKFFAKRLGEKEFPFEEEQWGILSKRLDDEGTVKPPFWLWFRKRLGYLLIPIITFLIGWYWQKGNDRTIPNVLPSEAPVEIPADPQSPAKQELMESTREELPDSRASSQLNELQEESKSDSEISTSDSKSMAKVFQKETTLVNQPQAELREGTEAPPIGFKNLAYHAVAPLSLFELDFPQAQLEEGITLPVGDSTQNEEEMKNPQWSVTLLAAPDFSSTNIKDLYNSLGQTVGLQFNRISREKIQLSFGALLNNKVYTAGKGEYSPSRGAYSNTGVQPDMTDAKCLVLEIPVSLGMRLFKTNRGSVWANVGLSSYVFLTEKYSYYYDEYDPDQPTGWEGKNENKHFVAGLGFSFVYAHRLSERSALIFEPYFKSTIQPVGHGNVDLLSTGLNVGFNYRLFSKN